MCVFVSACFCLVTVTVCCEYIRVGINNLLICRRPDNLFDNHFSYVDKRQLSVYVAFSSILISDYCKMSIFGFLIEFFNVFLYNHILS